MVLALSLIAVVAVTAVSIANFSDVTVLQEHRNEATAAADSLVEGGAAYSVADADRGALPSDSLQAWACVGQPTGTITMASGDTVGYNTQACNPQQANKQFQGFPCSLCALSSAAIGAGGGIFDHKFTLDLSGGAAMTTNSSIQFQQACVRASAIQMVGTYTASGENGNLGCAWSPNVTPAPVPHASIPDPLSYVSTPPLTSVPDRGSPSYSTTTTIQPGSYGNITAGGPAGTTLTLSAGTYIITGTFSVAGHMDVVGTGVVLYFTCGTSSAPANCGSPGSAGNLSIGGSGNVTLSAATTGPFANLVIYYDRKDNANLAIAGTGAYSITGATYSAISQFTLTGNFSGAAQFGGPIVVGSVNMNGSGGGSGLGLQGLGAGNTCTILDNKVTVGGVSKGHDVVQSYACAGGRSAIDALNYLP